MVCEIIKFLLSQQQAICWRLSGLLIREHLVDVLCAGGGLCVGDERRLHSFIQHVVPVDVIEKDVVLDVLGAVWSAAQSFFRLPDL